MTDEPPGDVEVLGPEPPPADGARAPRRWGWIVAGIAVAGFALVAWLTRPGGGTGPIADDVFEPGSRTRPLYPGAQGRLLFTIAEERRADELVGERILSVSLETGAVELGPVIPPVGTDRGVPAGPGIPPARGFALGPPVSTSAGILAFLADGAPSLGGERFVYTLDVSRGRLDVPARPVAGGRAFTWEPDGGLLVTSLEPADPAGPPAIVVRRFEPNGPATEYARLHSADVPRGIVVGGGRTLLLVNRFVDADDADTIVRIGADVARPLLTRWRVMGHGGRARFLVQRFPIGPDSGLFVWEPGRAPRRLEGFVPDRIVGWTPDRTHYAAIGGFRGQYGLWFVGWPNVPVFLMSSLDPTTETVDTVAFDEDAQAAFFVKGLDLWMVEVGSERARPVPLPDDVAREVPTGPVVWVP